MGNLTGFGKSEAHEHYPKDKSGNRDIDTWLRAKPATAISIISLAQVKFAPRSEALKFTVLNCDVEKPSIG